jgi:small subunit ribosomal protein S8
MNHSVSDLVIRIKNAAMARRHEVVLPFSNINLEIAKVLQKEGFLESVKVDKNGVNKILTAVIKYEKRVPILIDVNIVSKPSLRVYTSVSDIRSIEIKGRHKVIISTSKGVMSGAQAKKNGLGGEVLFEIW